MLRSLWVRQMLSGVWFTQKNISARVLVDVGLCSALASDYHYASLTQAALELSKSLGLARAWSLVSSQPASVLKLTDRGTLKPGLRADFIVIDSRTERIEGTFVQGCPTFLTGTVAHRLVGI